MPDSITTTVDNVAPGQSLKTGWDQYNAHGHHFVPTLMQNKAGGSRDCGDVVAVSTGNNRAFESQNTRGDGPSRKFVVVAETIATSCVGHVSWGGVVYMKSQGTINRNDWLVKSTAAEAVEASSGFVYPGPPPPGQVGYALEANASGFVRAFQVHDPLPSPFDPTWILSAMSAG